MGWIKNLFRAFKKTLGITAIIPERPDSLDISEERGDGRLLTVPKPEVNAFLERMERDCAGGQVALLIHNLNKATTLNCIPILEAVRIFGLLSPGNREKFIKAADLLARYGDCSLVYKDAEHHARWFDFCSQKAEEARQKEAAASQEA